MNHFIKYLYYYIKYHGTIDFYWDHCIKEGWGVNEDAGWAERTATWLKSE